MKQQLNVQKMNLENNIFASNTLSFNDHLDHYNPYSCDEYQASLGDLKVSLGIAYSSKQRDLIYQLRETVYQKNMSYLLNDDDGLPTSADKLDDISYLFYCRQGNTIIASCRYTPAINGVWETPEITQAANLVPTDKSKMLQIGRLLVAPEYRSYLVSELLVWAASDWLKQNTTYESFYAICVSALVRFYRHFGSKSVPKTKIVLPERENKTYRVVYGSMTTVAQTLETYLTERGGLLNHPIPNHCTNYPQVS